MSIKSLRPVDKDSSYTKCENTYDDNSTIDSCIIFGNSDVIDNRIASCSGYTCGMSIVDSPREIYLGEYPKQCVCAYDIESAYNPHVPCSDYGDLVCGSVVCSCGHGALRSVQ